MPVTQDMNGNIEVRYCIDSILIEIAHTQKKRMNSLNVLLVLIAETVENLRYKCD